MIRDTIFHITAAQHVNPALLVRADENIDTFSCINPLLHTDTDIDTETITAPETDNGTITGSTDSITESLRLRLRSTLTLFDQPA